MRDGELTTARAGSMAATVRAAWRSTPGVAGRTALTLRVQTGCDEECSYCIIPTTRGAGRSAAARRSASRHATRGRCRVTGRSRSPAFTSDRTDATCRDGIDADERSCGSLARVARRRAVSHQLARADGLHARRSSSHRARRRGSRRTFICRCSTDPTRCCAAMKRPYTVGVLSRLAGRTFARSCRTHRSARTSSWASRARPTRDFDRTASISSSRCR